MNGRDMSLLLTGWFAAIAFIGLVEGNWITFLVAVLFLAINLGLAYMPRGVR